MLAGGRFNRSASASRIYRRDDEVVHAITPVGYLNDKKVIKDSAIRFFTWIGVGAPQEYPKMKIFPSGCTTGKMMVWKVLNARDPEAN